MNVKKSPFLALTWGEADQGIFHHVPADKAGYIKKELAWLIAGLNRWTPVEEVVERLLGLGIERAEALAPSLVTEGLLVSEEHPHAGSFREDIVIVGYGLRLGRDASLAASAVIAGAARVISFDHKNRLEELRTLNPRLISLAGLMTEGHGRKQSLEAVAREALRLCTEEKDTIMAQYGNPRVGSFPTQELLRLAALEKRSTRLVPGMSFLENAFVEFNFDPFEGFTMLGPTQADRADPRSHTCIVAVGGYLPHDEQKGHLEELCRKLAPHYPPEHRVQIIIANEYVAQKKSLRLDELPALAGTLISGGTTLYLPPVTS